MIWSFDAALFISSIGCPSKDLQKNHAKPMGYDPIQQLQICMRTLICDIMEMEIGMADRQDIGDKKKRDFDDLQNEIAGRDDVGRMKRFLPESPHGLEAKRKKREREEAHSRLIRLLQDPIYRVRYDNVLTRLEAAEVAADAALATIGHRIEAAEAALQEIQDKAARLPDGTRVYRDDNGNVRREDGSLVDEDLAATIIWRGDEPSYAAYTNADETLRNLKDSYGEVSTYRNDVLGSARDRMESDEKPPSLEELDRILNDIDTQMPDVGRAQQPDNLSAAGTDPTAISLPDLSSKR